ncbi:hypothetical protein GQ457_17G007420 [Hibiscus cannabinus]
MKRRRQELQAGWDRLKQGNEYRNRRYSSLRFNASTTRRCRIGYTVFVENVSKRIHVSALREAFQCYGQVADVYIAYWNRKRIKNPTTFAFVRFKTAEEAKCAARKGDNRKMDGYYIRVSIAKVNGNGDEENKPVCQISQKVMWKSALKDNRSFKEALMGTPKVNPSNNKMESAGGEKVTGVRIEFMEDQLISPSGFDERNSGSILLSKSDMEWRKLSLVAQIKGMYNAALVQEALASDGIQVKVCPWFGNLSVMQFANNKELEFCWSRRSEMLRLWCDDLERLEGFEGKRRIKVWIVLKDVPLQCWSDGFFRGLCNRWGSVVEVEEDTSKRNRFDEARVLVMTQKVSIIPDRVPVILNGSIHEILLKTEEFEGDRRFIDDVAPVATINFEEENASFNSPRRYDNVFVEHTPKDYSCQQDLSLESCQKGQNSQFEINNDSMNEKLGGSSGGLIEIPIQMGSGLNRAQLETDNGSLGDESEKNARQMDISISHGSRFMEVPIEVAEDMNSPLFGGIRINISQSHLSIRRDRHAEHSSFGKLGVRTEQTKKGKGFKGRMTKKNREREASLVDKNMVLRKNDIVSANLDRGEEVEDEAAATLKLGQQLEIVFDAPEEVILEGLLKLDSVEGKGLGKNEKVRSVVKGIVSSRASIVFLQESKISIVNPVLERRLMCKRYRQIISSPSNGASGGLISIWDDDVFTIEKSIVHDRWILLIGTLIPFKLKIGLINIYAPNVASERRCFFDSLKNQIRTMGLPMIIGGDFNAVLSQEEKVGSSFDTQSAMVFDDFIQECELMDLPLNGGKFTWRRGGNNLAASRLDRFLVSPEVMQQCPSISQRILPRSLSDHNPILLEEGKYAERARPFKWFSHWAQDSGYVDFVKATVAERVEKGVGELLKKIKGATKEWAKRQKAKEVESIEEVEKKIEQLESSALTSLVNSEIFKQIRELRSSIWERYRKEEREWLQKSRLRWFKEGDKNTRFFHLTASRRRNANFIAAIESENGEIVDHKQIESAFVKYFKDSFNGSNTIPVRHFGVQLKELSQASRSLLESRFSVREVWEAISSADGNRAPGPDGFNLDFFKSFWPQLKDEIMKLFDDFYKGKITDKSLNHSFIALIPKLKSPTRMEDYRPISLVSSLYKIIARVLSRRLAGCLAEVVGENQFAFTAGKQITDCNLIANEVIDDIKKNNRAAIVFKADFSKAYDTVDWKFLELIMERMGFGKRWRKWIRLCISTPSISVLVNGIPSKMFNIKRGLRQGCPLSPLLFNLVGEALSALFHKAMEAGVLKGVQVGNSNLKISHIQFADDLILFGVAKEEEVLNMKRLLRIFGLCSGLNLNLKKTKLYGVNVERDVLDRWAERVSCSCDSFPTVYLGLPLGVTRNVKEIWDPILQIFQKRLDGWKGKILSFGGRITLAKSVLSSLPIYYLSMFQLPACIAGKLNSLISKFIWGNKEGRTIHWVKWETVCKPKIRGGLGLWDLRLKNRALLNKWIWRYGEEKESLWRKVVDAKYGYDSQNLIPEVWFKQSLKSKCKPVWNMTLFGLAWNIWLARNNVVFKAKGWDAEQVFESSLLLIGHWCRAKWPEVCMSAVDFARCPTALSFTKG